MYSEGEGCNIKVLPGAPFTKDMVANIGVHPVFINSAFSPALGIEVKSKAINLRGCNVFALFFEDGSIYEVGRGWRGERIFEEDKKWINEQHAVQSQDILQTKDHKRLLDDVNADINKVLQKYSGQLSDGTRLEVLSDREANHMAVRRGIFCEVIMWVPGGAKKEE